MTLSEASRLRLPLALVGLSEAEVSRQLESDTPPTWFRPLIESQKQQTLLPDVLEDEWIKFRENLHRPSEPVPPSTSLRFEDL